MSRSCLLFLEYFVKTYVKTLLLYISGPLLLSFILYTLQTSNITWTDLNWFHFRSSVYFTIDTDNDVPSISGGPFKAPYEFSQLHYHWGDNDSYGSEGFV